MNTPSITFFCELHSPDLEKLFSSPTLIPQLRRMGANISMGIQDFSAERVKIIKKLTRAGVPVTAWLLLSVEEGYWTSLDTIHLTEKKYTDFLAWTRSNDLTWAAVGLDIEPRIDFMQRLATAFPGQLPFLTQRFFSLRKYAHLEQEARDLIARIRDDGYAVETYQFPTVIEERRANSTLLARLFGLPALDADREVLMLYSSMFDRAGEAILWSYAREIDAVGVGSTGGGVSIEGLPTLHKMRWLDLKRDLLIAAHHASHLYIFSLEGCVEQNFLDRLETLDWQSPQPLPTQKAREITLFRRVFQYTLWMLSHPIPSFLTFFPLVYLIFRRKTK